MNNVAEQIRDILTIPEVLRYYGFSESRHKRIPCPLHGGKNANFCYTDQVFHCWVCGAKGDLIGLVMQLFGISFKAAVMKLNTDFSLGLSARRPTYRDRQLMTEDRRVKDAAKALEVRKRQMYNGLAVFHREVFRRLCQEPENGFLEELEKELECWLEDNAEEVVTPWNP